MTVREAPAEGTRRGGRRLVVVVVLGIALLAQGAWAFRTSPEPYPAVRMPSFAGAPDAAGLFPTTTVAITLRYAQGPPATPAVEELMAGFRPTEMRSSLDHVFAPENEGVSPRPADDPAVRAWLRARATELGGGRTPTAAEFCYRRSDVDVATGTYVDVPECRTTRVAL